MIQVTIALLVSADEVNVGEFVPAFTPFTCHWYDGVEPPFEGVAVNVMLCPVQMLLSEAEILTDGVTELLTVIVIELLDAVVGLAQRALDVTTQLITSLFANAEVE